MSIQPSSNVVAFTLFPMLIMRVGMIDSVVHVNDFAMGVALDCVHRRMMVLIRQSRSPGNADPESRQSKPDQTCVHGRLLSLRAI